MSWLKKFSTQDLIVIAIISALGMAIKPIITPVIHLVSSPLMIPGGSLAGGFYMLWLGIVIVLVPRPGAALLTALAQGMTTVILGQFGNHGIVSLISYTAPGLVAEIVALLFREKHSLGAQITICSSANVVGTLLVAWLVMRQPPLILTISVITAIVSGIGGGIISYTILQRLLRYNFFSARPKRHSNKRGFNEMV